VDLQPAVPLARSFDALVGLEILEQTPEMARGRVAVRDELKQPMGLVHGGVFASIAESLASLATAWAVHPDGLAAQGMANATSFLRPILDGTIHAEARRLHRGRTTWVWDVTCSDDAGRPCAITRMTIAVRPARERGSGPGGGAAADGGNGSSGRAAPGGGSAPCGGAAAGGGDRSPAQPE
jgi:uncharacterized protein (TIGR00369 family)